jgi:general secretion pathway protein G
MGASTHVRRCTEAPLLISVRNPRPPRQAPWGPRCFVRDGGWIVSPATMKRPPVRGGTSLGAPKPAKKPAYEGPEGPQGSWTADRDDEGVQTPTGRAGVRRRTRVWGGTGLEHAGHSAAAALRRGRHPPFGGAGFTLIEILVALAIIGILSGLAIPGYSEFIYRAEVGRAISEVEALASEIQGFYFGTGKYPANLGEIGRDGMPDPWGNPYQYLNIADDDPPNGALRKDRNLVPVNSDYDLYSVGRDGDSAGALTAAVSKDDVVRANNGGFIGLAEKY